MKCDGKRPWKAALQNRVAVLESVNILHPKINKTATTGGGGSRSLNSFKNYALKRRGEPRPHSVIARAVILAKLNKIGDADQLTGSVLIPSYCSYIYIYI